MNGKHAPIDHGELKPTPAVRKAPLPIPRSLKNQTLTWKSSNYEEAVALYGLWKMRCLKSTSVAGKVVEPSDTFLCVGHDAVALASYGMAEFCDERIAKEAEALDQVEKLGLNKPPRIADEPAFNPQLPPRGRTKLATI